MSYFDNLDNGFLNKYEKNLKNKISLSFDSSLKTIKILCNLQQFQFNGL
jgi:hypothetical protein